MTTFSSREHTHLAVPPQRRALESTAADTPGSRDETGRGLRRFSGGTGAGHGREETPGTGTRTVGRHPDSADTAGEGANEGREASHHPAQHQHHGEASDGTVGSGAARVFVLDRHGSPLMPCHPARARKLLDRGRARVVRAAPFTIRLTDRLAAESAIDGLALRIDPGSKGTGIVLTDDKQEQESAPTGQASVRRGLWSAVVEHRGQQIKKAMGQRCDYRRGRRSRNLRYRAPRFNNRKRAPGWLPPSLRHRVDTTLSTTKRLMKLAPVVELHVERVAFDVHSLSAGKPLEGAEYQQGTLHGYEVREYLLAKWGRACAYCGATGVPLQIEHIQPRSHGGSDRVSNLTLACAPCNQAKSSLPLEVFLAKDPGLVNRIKQQSKTPLRDAAAMNATRNRLFAALTCLGVPVYGWSGGRTKCNRVRAGLPKSHTLDALAVGAVDHDAGQRIVRHPDTVLVIACTGRGTHARTRPDRYGFPRLRLPRTKRFFGYATGDLVRAVVPSGRNQGTHMGRVAVRASGSFNIKTVQGLVQSVHHRHLRLLQRSDGYGYTSRPEARG